MYQFSLCFELNKMKHFRLIYVTSSPKTKLKCYRCSLKEAIPQNRPSADKTISERVLYQLPKPKTTVSRNTKETQSVACREKFDLFKHLPYQIPRITRLAMARSAPEATNR